MNRIQQPTPIGSQFLSLTERGKNGVLRWLGGTVVILFFWFIIGSFLALPFFVFAGGNLTGTDVTGILQEGDPFLVYIGTNVSFLGIWLGVWLVVRFIHHRAFRTLITPAPKMDWTRVAKGFAVWLVLVALFQVVEFVIYPQRAQFTFDPARWLYFLPFVLVLTPIQTSAEELLFRGYWMQGIGRLSKNFVILTVLNGILFALPHMLNPEVLANPDSTLLLFLNYFTTGAALALFTLRDNRLELALGAHASNNLFAALIVNYTDSALTVPAIFTNPVIDAGFGLVSLIIVSISFYFIVFRVLNRPRDPVANS